MISPLINPGVSGDFILSLEIRGPLACGAIVECVGMAMAGEVGDEIITSEDFLIKVDGTDEDGVNVVSARRSTFGWLPLNTVFTQFHTLSRMLRRAGCKVIVKGAWAECLNSAADQEESFTDKISNSIAWIGINRFSHDDNRVRLQIAPETLDQIHRALSGPATVYERAQKNPEFQSAFPNYRPFSPTSIETLLDHETGLEVLVKSSSHRIAGTLPPLSPAERQELEDKLLHLSGVAMTLKMTREEILAQVVPVRPIEELIAQLDSRYAPFLKQVDDEFYEVYALSDDGRYPISPVRTMEMPLDDGEVCELTYTPWTLNDLRAAGVPELAFAWFNLPINANIEISDALDGWFSIRCGQNLFWGENRTRRLLWRENSSAIFQFRTRY